MISRLHDGGIEAVAVANPLRSLSGDAACVRDVIASIGRPVVLVGHSCGGLVITEAASSRNDAVLRQDAFHHQFAADIPATEAALMAATQRPVTQAALTQGLPTSEPAWQSIPSWFVFGDADLNIPVAVHRAGAERPSARGILEISGASHAIGVSNPEAVAYTILDAVSATVPSG